jgi:WD40 repeat protein
MRARPTLCAGLLQRGLLWGLGDRTLRLWDLENGRTIRTLEGHTGGVSAVAVTPDGRRAVSGSFARKLRLWDVESGHVIRSLEGHQGSVTAVAVTPDGRHAVSGSYDKTLRFWDLESGQTTRQFQGHTGWVNAVAVTRDGRRAISASDDRTLRLWDLESGKDIANFTGEDEMTSCAVAPNGQTIFCADPSGRVHFLRIVEADKTSIQSAIQRSNWCTAWSKQ